jgi:hypothetical protein
MARGDRREEIFRDERDRCLRPYDEKWLNNQQEIALRHTTFKKNKVDCVVSTPYVPLNDIIAFVAIMNETIKPHRHRRRQLVRMRCIQPMPCQRISFDVVVLKYEPDLSDFVCSLPSGASVSRRRENRS